MRLVKSVCTLTVQPKLFATTPLKMKDAPCAAPPTHRFGVSLTRSVIVGIDRFYSGVSHILTHICTTEGNSCAIRFGIGHSKRMSLPQIWPDSVSNERDTVDPYQNTGGLLFSSLTPSSQRDV